MEGPCLINLITGNEGLISGTVQTPSGNPDDNTANPTVDNPWKPGFGGAGMSGTRSASNVLAASGNTARLI